MENTIFCAFSHIVRTLYSFVLQNVTCILNSKLAKWSKSSQDTKNTFETFETRIYLDSIGTSKGFNPRIMLEVIRYRFETISKCLKFRLAKNGNVSFSGKKREKEREMSLTLLVAVNAGLDVVRQILSLLENYGLSAWWLMILLRISDGN